MESVTSLIEGLAPPQKSAIGIVKLALDCFNSGEGCGLFAGVERYNVLAGRVEICAVQADSLPRFWALLLRRMQWPVPPKAADSRIVHALLATNPSAVLRTLATETSSLITLSRMLHDADKQARRGMRQSEQPDPFADLPGNTLE